MTEASGVLDTLLEHIAQGVAMFDTSRRLVVWNAHYREILGFPDGYLRVGLAHADMALFVAENGGFGDGEPRQLAADRVEALWSGELEVSQIDLGGGRAYDLRAHATPDGGLVLTYTDMTERKQRELALLKSESRFKDYANSSSDWFWEMGPDLRFTYLSKRVEDVAGISRAHFIGKTRAELAGGDPDDPLWRGHHETMARREPFRDFEYVTRRGADGRETHFSISGVPFFGSDGAFLGYRGTGRDVTQRIEAEEKVRDLSWQAEWARSQLFNAIDSLNDAFVLYDADDRLVICNERYREFYALSADLIVPGATFEEIIRGGAERGQYPDAVGRVDAWVAERLTTHYVANTKIEQKLADGRWLRIDERRTPDGGTVGFRVDITELKRAREEAESASAAKSEFLSVVSHELRTPLTSIKGALSMLEAQTCGSLPEKSAHLLKVAVRNVERLSTIIDDLLDLEKIQSGRMALTMAPIDVAELVAKSVEMNQSYAHRLGVRIEISGERPAVSVMGDEGRLMQVLANLLSNAAKFTPDGNAVTVSWTEAALENGAGRRRDGVRIAVSDVGPGIPEEFHDRIFQPFAQAENPLTRSVGGTGLGLSICRVITEQHGGRISFETDRGKGTVFFVDLPRHR